MREQSPLLQPVQAGLYCEAVLCRPNLEWLLDTGTQ